MKKIIIKISRVIFWILGIIIMLIAISILIGFILHNTYYKNQLKAIKPYGEMVEVDNKKMHVYSIGNGKDTIVLLPGHGVPLPSADFGPLMRKLSKKYRVVTVEYFGVGFSDETGKPRACENYMNEIRSALNMAYIKPPYIIMPHSISGVYSEYYAAKHPEEVKGLLLLDTTSTTLNVKMAKNDIKPYRNSKFIQDIGLQPMLFSLMSQENLKKAGFEIITENGYTQKEINDYKKYSCYHMNNTMIEQLRNLMDCINEVKQLPFPNDIPVLKIIAKQTLEDGINGLPQEEEHIKRLGKNAKYVVLDGNHFIYHSQLEEISRLTDEFVDRLNSH